MVVAEGKLIVGLSEWGLRFGLSTLHVGFVS
jgi:hypothetical protein